MPAILVEPLFIGNASDVSKYTAEKVALAIAKGIDSNIDTTEIKNNEFNEEDYLMNLFGENWYLYRYNDVKQAVEKRTFKNGYEHYIKHGKNEKRQPVPPIPTNFNEGDYLELNPYVKNAVDKGYAYQEHSIICYMDLKKLIEKYIREKLTKMLKREFRN